jgi:hypothetical protein
LHKVTSELEQLNKGVIDLNKLLVGCAYLKRNNKLDSVLNKQTGHNGLNADIKLDFDFSKGYLELSVKGVKNHLFALASIYTYQDHHETAEPFACLVFLE